MNIKLNMTELSQAVAEYVGRQQSVADAENIRVVFWRNQSAGPNADDSLYATVEIDEKGNP